MEVVYMKTRIVTKATAIAVVIVILMSTFFISGLLAITIPSGKFDGKIRVNLTDAFFTDPLSTAVNYVVPLKILPSTQDSVLTGVPLPEIGNAADRRVNADWMPGFEPKDYTLFAIKYINKYHGTYLHRGVDETLDAENGNVLSTRSYQENYIENASTIKWIKENGHGEENLHLSVPVRSFRSNKLSNFVESVLSLDVNKATQLYSVLNKDYPFVITRNISLAKKWINSMKRGSERSGIVISSGAKRLRAKGIDSENGIRSNSDKSKIINWFLADNEDIRSSSFLEIPATQFAIQGLELDWLLLAWGGDLSYSGSKWNFKSFSGCNWRNIKEENIIKREYN